jgi:hypothetical protein
MNCNDNALIQYGFYRTIALAGTLSLRGFSSFTWFFVFSFLSGLPFFFVSLPPDDSLRPWLEVRLVSPFLFFIDRVCMTLSFYSKDALKNRAIID